MKTNRPAWFCIANLGGGYPLERGGKFLLIDRRGVYDPELWVWDPDTKLMHAIILERCHKIGEYAVGDNPYHVNTPAWFGTRENIIYCSSDWTIPGFIDALVGSDPIERARAYYDMAIHFGMVNFDQNPDIYTIPEARKLINRFLRQIKQSEKWSDGLEK